MPVLTKGVKEIAMSNEPRLPARRGCSNEDGNITFVIF